ncbi:MAG: lamin tail domain-containing protein [Flavobacteriales bacterium]|nr:lamin tail domain-containing protein [Flavobacteriales bacterium]
MRPTLLALSSLIAVGAEAQIVINEMDYDQVSTDNAEYIEIKNIGLDPWPMNDVSVIMFNGSSGTAEEYRTISSPEWPELQAGEYFVICGNASLTQNCDHDASPNTNLVQNGPLDAVALVRTSNGDVIDVVSYGGSLPDHVEGTGTSAQDTNLNDGVSIGRSPDGTDTDDNDADFFLMCSTPGSQNLIDPIECDLSTGVAAPVNVGGIFLLYPQSSGRVVVFAREAAPTEMRLEVFTANGALIQDESRGTTAQAQWNIDGEALRGSLLVVRYTTSEGAVTRRIVVP